MRFFDRQTHTPSLSIYAGVKCQPFWQNAELIPNEVHPLNLNQSRRLSPGAHSVHWPLLVAPAVGVSLLKEHGKQTPRLLPRLHADSSKDTISEWRGLAGCHSAAAA
jgi:hypothetical protein